jgi:predicted DsbA family dithiol-disulfide isomerase
MASSQVPEATGLSIIVISDVVCPWCYIGKRRLEKALALYRERFPDKPAPVVAWWPFQLSPDIPAEGVDREEYMTRKFGKERIATMHERIEGIGRDVGIPFAFDKIRRSPNTLAAHALIELAGEHGVQDELAEAMFRGYFIEGQDMSNQETLRKLATQAGLPAEAVEQSLTEQSRQHVQQREHQARQIGVQGVPFFILNNRLAVSGAQESNTLLDAMIEAEKEPAPA